jgi:hypothetical protein
MRIVIALLTLIAAAPTQARNVIDWQCGNSRVRLEVDKETNPPSYDVTFEAVRPGKIVRTGTFEWNTDTYVATVNGKPCRKIPYQQ